MACEPSLRKKGGECPWRNFMYVRRRGQGDTGRRLQRIGAITHRRSESQELPQISYRVLVSQQSLSKSLGTVVACAASYVPAAHVLPADILAAQVPCRSLVMLASYLFRTPGLEPSE